MISVLKVDHIDLRATPGELRRLFKEHGARPEDIHLVLHQGSGKHNGTAFLIFTDPKEAENGLRVGGTILQDTRISVRNSTPREFDKIFPGVTMLSKSKNLTYSREKLPGPGVLKVENIDYNASPGDIRRFFKDHGARPEDIHLVLQPNSIKHNGCAFLIFSIAEESENGLKLDNMLFRDNRLTIKRSNPKEFDRFFPNVSMITKPPSNMNMRGRGRGRGRGMMRGGPSNTGGRNIPRPFPPPFESRNYENRSNSVPSGRGRLLRGGGRGGGPPNRRGSGRFGGQPNPFFTSEHDQMNNGRARSRSPINPGRDNARESFLRNFSSEQHPSRDNRREFLDRRRPDVIRGSSRQSTFSNTRDATIPDINERKYLRVIGFPFNASEVDIQNFFRPILTRDIYIMRNSGGKFAGKFSGSAIVEFFSESDARQAIKMDGKKFGHQTMSVIRPGKEDIERTIQQSVTSNSSSGPSVPDFSAINAVAQNNPQVQHLLNLLTATVNTIAGAAAVSAQKKTDTKREFRNDRIERNRDDPVISRVASSANIDVGDIKLGRVVGIRNLPYSVTPDEILQFFHGYHAIPDSVRIHYLEDRRCSGDAIICFRGNRDARNAVSDLNKKTIGRRNVELFFL